MENPPFEDVLTIQDGDFPLLCLFTGGYIEVSGIRKNAPRFVKEKLADIIMPYYASPQ